MYIYGAWSPYSITSQWKFHFRGDSMTQVGMWNVLATRFMTQGIELWDKGKGHGLGI